MLKANATRAALLVLAAAALSARADDFGGLDIINIDPTDTTPPVISGPVYTSFEWQGSAITLTPALLDVTATDDTDGPVPVTLSQTSAGLGTTSVTASAMDAAGNVATVTFDVVVADHLAPQIQSLSADPSVLMKRNHKFKTVTISAAATDDGDPAPTARIQSVTCIDDDVVTGPSTDDEDWHVTGDLTVDLRCERSGHGSGRIYRIEVACTDASGNTSIGTVDVTVPHDSRAKHGK